MRISVEIERQNRTLYRVILDGTPVNKAAAADDEEGWVDVWVRNPLFLSWINGSYNGPIPEDIKEKYATDLDLYERSIGILDSLGSVPATLLLVRVYGDIVIEEIE
jgi:hypothetical protein